VAKRHVPAVTFSLNKPSYRFEDTGWVEITNNTGSEMKISFFCADAYVKLPSVSVCGAAGRVPFHIKPGALLNAQRFLRKIPMLHTAIEITATAGDFSEKKILPFIVGDWA
jgi:hypothetical protein